MLLLLVIIIILLCAGAHRVFLQYFKTPMDFKNKVVVITGAAHGIGKRLATKIANDGAHVMLVDINTELLQKTAAEIKLSTSARSVHAFTCDVSNCTSVKATVKEIQDTVAKSDDIIAKGGAAAIDVLINNAGIVSGKPLLDLREEDVTRTFGVNSFSHFWWTQAVLPSMLSANTGLIVTVSSVMSQFGGASLSDYCASKWAATGFHESLRLELRRLGKHREIKTLLVCPYAINTGMFDGIFESSPWVHRALMPILEPNVVVDQIYNAMRRGDIVLTGCADGILSYIYPWLPIPLRILPPEVMDIIVGKLGGCNGMDTFKGSKKR